MHICGRKSGVICHFDSYPLDPAERRALAPYPTADIISKQRAGQVPLNLLCPFTKIARAAPVF
jgi:hypothetical protein